MKSKSETRESYETKKVTKTEKYFVLEEINDLKNPDFLRHLKKETSDGYRYCPDNCSSKYRLTKELESLLKSKMEVDQRLYIDTGKEILIIDNEDVRDQYGSFGKTTLLFDLLPGIETLDYFKK